MNNINIINGRIIDSDLINQEFNDCQFQDAFNGNLKLEEITNINIKKVLIFVNPEIISLIDLNNIDNDTKMILKLRSEIFELKNKNIFDSIINFYQFLENKSLYGIMKKILNLTDSEYKLYSDNYLIPDFIINILKDGLKNETFVKEMLLLDSRCCEFISNDYLNKEELVKFMVENNIIDEKFIKDNIGKTLSNDREFIIKYILMTPLAYRCFDHNMIDEEMIKILISSNPGDNYKNFYSDFRFYRKYIASENSVIYDVISKYIPLIRQGQDYIGLCPFHDDHHPSLRVSPRKNIWRCFACGKHGNAKTFIKEYMVRSNNELLINQISYKKNQFLYYLFANLPEKLKNDKNIVKLFLEKDGCILKLVSKELKYDIELVEVAMSNDITAFRYIINNEELKNKYLALYPILNYYLPNNKLIDIMTIE